MASNTQTAVTKRESKAGTAIDRSKAFWQGLVPKQRMYLGVGIAITLATLTVLGNLMLTTDYKPLMTGLEAADAQTISAQLLAKKIPYVLSPDGTSISVPADQVDAARLEVASHDSVHSGRIGFEIFDKVSWGQTEFDEKVNYQRALEGELERTIQTIGNVKSARVHIVMATDSVFIDRDRGAKASVILQLKKGSLSRQELSAISRLVAGAVDELKPSDVTIVDADSDETVGQIDGSPGEGDGIEQELTRRLIATLAPVVGSDHIRASVNVEYETGSSEESQEKYDPAVSATLTMQHSEDGTGPGAVIGGVPGTSSNLPNVKSGITQVAAKDAGQFSRSDNNTYGVNRTTRHVIEPAGGIRRLTAAVLLDDAVQRKLEKGKWVETRQKRQPEELRLISDLAQAAIGFNAARGDMISVQNLTFDHAEAEEILPATLAERAQKDLNDYSSIIRYVGLGGICIVVYLLMIRPIQKRVLSTEAPLLADTLARGQADIQVDMLPESATNLAQRNLMLKKQVADFVRAEPESSATAVRAWLREGAE
jgi:flagellar M-ring protein FliF